MTRVLVLILLFANVIYLGWEIDRQAGIDLQNSAASRAIPAGTQRLYMLGELASPPQLRQEQIADPSAGSDATRELVSQLPDINLLETDIGAVDVSCFTFGPLPDEMQATGLSDWFRSRRVSTNIKSTEEAGKRLFWIYLTPRDTRQNALAVTRDLKKKGITDFRLIGKGDLRNAVSLGLFSTQSGVNARLEELKKQGYKPIVVPYTNVQRTYWLDVALPIDETLLAQVFSDYPARFNSVPVDCGPIALSGGSQ